ncbi:protein FAM134C-like isoform X2 [Mizuhopecten yessoensis]|uniref:protein FAM134C-like isoform X2 n=1 Tax=Mizuhopecten yessoensis TaxID=6573 RepID=UPI000B45D5E6|nr:protein FAM134C-like isoform X2 [Mizuhopecten yessoensis]
MENSESRSDDEHVQRTENMFKRILSPIEPLVMRIQSLLVWEYPRKSAVLFICVHGLFWFLAAVGCRFYFVVSTVTYIIYLVQTWKHKIWPEIRVPPAVPEDPDSWTPVHPRLLSVPELCQYIAHVWCSCSNILHYWLTFRRVYPFLFCVMSCTFFFILAMIGHYIPGLMLAYIIVISTLLGPSVLYHNLLKRVYLKFEPIFMKMEYSIKLKNKWSFKVPRSSTSVVSAAGQVEISDTDSETDFTPSLDPVTTAALARAITDSEDESLDPSLSTPLLSKEPSIDLEDEDDQERQVDFDVNFEEGIPEMPSFEDVLDNTDDELLELHIPKKRSKHRRQKLEDMNFVPEHFGDTSDSEEEETDLNFPSLMAESLLDSESNSGGDMLSGATGAFMSKTLSSVIGSALSGMSNLKPNTASTSRGDSSNVPSSVSYKQRSGDEVDFHVSPNNDKPTGPDHQQVADDSSDIDIGEEFEFLDQYDLEDDEK